MTVRYGIGWDGWGRPKPVRTAALGLDAIALLLRAAARAADQRLDIPAADPFVTAAGASDMQETVDSADDRVADFSSRSRFGSPDVVAAGTGMVSVRVPGSARDVEFPGARVGGSYCRGSGTSQTAAVSSGLVAQLVSARPELVPDEVKALPTTRAVDLVDPREADGAGRVDMARTFAAPVPDVASVVQRWAPAVVDQRTLDRAMRDNDGYTAGEPQRSGRRWSGRRCSGRRWSGASWIDY